MPTEIVKEFVSLGFLEERALEARPGLIFASSEREFAPDETIYRHEDESRSLFVLREGLVKLVTHLANGQSRIVRLHKPGSMIGMDGLLGESHGHTAVAVGAVRAFEIPHSELRSLKREEPHLYAGLLEKWYEYLTYADTWITEFSTGKIRARVARLVRFLARFDEDTGPQIVELLSTEEMADILGVTPESVSREIADFKREGILESIENNPEPLFNCDWSRLRQETLE